MQNIAILVVLSLTTAASAADWPQFRGPSGDGRSPIKNLPVSWGGILEPPTWQTRVPGGGWSSPIIVENRIWLTAAEQTAHNETTGTTRLADHKYGHEEFKTDATVTLIAVELDLNTGSQLQKIELATIDQPKPIHVVNSYASPTPTSDGRHVYFHFGSLGTFCVDPQSGSIVWQRTFPIEDITGPATSPILYERLLILVRDGADEQYIVAIDKSTGQTVWRQSRPKIDVIDDKHRRSFSTPIVMPTRYGPQLIAPTANWAISYDPANGHEIWRARIRDGHALVPSPVFDGDLVYVCSGYPQPELVAINVTGRGDVTQTHQIWSYDKQVPLISSPIVANQMIYFVSSIGVATCLDANTGQPLWRERLTGNFAASPIFAAEKLFFTSTEGVTYVIPPRREFSLLFRNESFGRTMASIAVTHRQLLIRNSTGVTCWQASAP